MRGYELSFDEPARNLALDEALLNAAESGDAGESLRFWESPTYFVVLGVSHRVDREVNVEGCARDGVPVTRRCSAGGCVLQGPGSLNYSLVLDMTSDPELATIRASYCSILTRIRDAIRGLGISAALEGTSDLAVNGIKFSGNAQRRKKRYLLHHGTVLYDMDLGRVGRYLREPQDRPKYRGGRPHEEFIRNLPVSRGDVTQEIANAFGVKRVGDTMSESILDRAARLCLEKYATNAWTFRR